MPILKKSAVTIFLIRTDFEKGFNYEGRTLQCSMKKSVEYGGQETPVTLYWNVSQALVGGTYNVSIFADGNMIGSKNFAFN